MDNSLSIMHMIVLLQLLVQKKIKLFALQENVWIMKYIVLRLINVTKKMHTYAKIIFALLDLKLVQKVFHVVK